MKTALCEDRVDGILDHDGQPGPARKHPSALEVAAQSNYSDPRGPPVQIRERTELWPSLLLPAQFRPPIMDLLSGRGRPAEARERL
jgi:hypothetical protein